MKAHRWLLLALAAIFFAACNDNPAWEGGKSTSKAQGMAAETCKCLHEMMGKEPGYDLAAILEEVKKINDQHPKDLQDAVLQAETPAISKALETEEEFSMKMDECECMKPVHDLLLEKGVDFNEMMSEVDVNCLLGAFYN